MSKRAPACQQKGCDLFNIAIVMMIICLCLVWLIRPAPVLAEDQTGSGRKTQADLVHTGLVTFDSVDLIEKAKILDGQEIIYQGEVIGDVMRRKDGYWINVLNDETAIGIWITAEQRALIAVSGKYGVQGDQAAIIGCFNRACPEHGGDLDIHASSVEIIRSGFAKPTRIDLGRMILAALLLVLAISCLIVLQTGRIRQRQKRPKI